jgi:hyperosmotically inducible protein
MGAASAIGAMAMASRMSLAVKRAGLAPLFVMGALVIASPAFADDAALKQRVEERLEKAKLETRGEIDVEVNDGLVTLRGAVDTVDAQRDAEKAALEESKMVDNRLKIVPEQRTDADIRKDVRSAVLRYPYYSIFDDIEYSIDDGVVVLHGSVYRPNRRTDIDGLVARIPGVREIQNEIEVQPASLFDDQLRRELVRAIYGSDQLGHYGIQPNPPIHIIVNRGKVTLTGYVNSQVDKALVNSMARQTLAFDVSNQVNVDGQSSGVDSKPDSQGDK